MMLSMISLVSVSKLMVGRGAIKRALKESSLAQVWLFKTERLRKDQDYFKCIVNIDDSGSAVSGELSSCYQKSCCLLSFVPCCLSPQFFQWWLAAY